MSETNKNTLGYKLAAFLCSVVYICATTCIAAAMISLTVKFIMWLFQEVFYESKAI